jgi:hypothetical protein
MKSTLLYLALVGIPILILIAIVRAGERITPPPYVGGEWLVERPDPQAAPGCLPAPAPGRPLRLIVEQSGTVVELSFRSIPRANVSARMREGLIRTEPMPGRPPCTHGHVLEARPEGMDRLSGRWFVPGCDPCAVIPFAATRPPDAAVSVTQTAR